MKEILNYPRCENIKDLENFKDFMLSKMNVVFDSYKFKSISITTLNMLKYELKDKYPIVRDVRHLYGGMIAVEFNEIYLFSKNLVINEYNQIELNDGRYKLYIDNDNQLHISDIEYDDSELSEEISYVCEMIK